MLIRMPAVDTEARKKGPRVIDVPASEAAARLAEGGELVDLSEVNLPVPEELAVAAPVPEVVVPAVVPSPEPLLRQPAPKAAPAKAKPVAKKPAPAKRKGR